jgi:hypothetical protein
MFPTSVLLLFSVMPVSLAQDEPGTSGYIDAGGVKLHYRTMGQGPLLIMIHNIPDYWYAWRDQMPTLAKRY